MRTGKFKIHSRRNPIFGNKYYWFTLSATNGKVIATSQTYKSRLSCINGISSVIHNAATATIEEIK